MQYISKLPRPYIQWPLSLDRPLDSAVTLYCTIYILLPSLQQDGCFNACVNVFWRNLGPYFVLRNFPRISQSEPFLLAICYTPHRQWRFYLSSDPSRKHRLIIPSRIVGICRQITCSSQEPSTAKHWRKACLQTEHTKLNRAASSSKCQWYFRNSSRSQISHQPQSREVQRWQDKAESIFYSTQSQTTA